MPKIKRITSHYYGLLSSHRYHSFKTPTGKETKLVLDMKNDGGEITFIVNGADRGEPLEIYNPETGIYSYPLQPGLRYVITVRAIAARGLYIFRLEISDPEDK